MHPEYPCAHCITAAAVGTVLEAEFRDPWRAPARPMRRIAERELRQEVDSAHIWAASTCATQIGDAMGRKVAELALQNFVRPQ